MTIFVSLEYAIDGNACGTGASHLLWQYFDIPSPCLDLDSVQGDEHISQVDTTHPLVVL
jgi:hypothetical protein